MNAKEPVFSSGKESELFRRFAEGKLRPEEFHDLEQRLLAGAELRERFVRFRGIEAGLYEIIQSPRGPLHASSGVHLPYRRLRNWRLAGGVCVAIGLAVSGVFMLYTRDERAPEPAGGTPTADAGQAVEAPLRDVNPVVIADHAPADARLFDDGPSWSRSNDVRISQANMTVAKFSRSVNVEWSARAHRWSIGDAVQEGDSIEMSAGRVELIFDSGAVMTVLGPAKLEMLSRNSVLLRSGTATTRIENVDGGDFRVLTPSASVFDLGTEFGVRVDSTGRTDVVVFDGAVDLKPAHVSHLDDILTRRLSVGEAVSTTGAGDWQRLVSIESDAFPFGDRMFDVTRKRPVVIAGVSDDYRSPDFPNYYRVYHAALAEDSRAYVDRNYEWNGIDADGIPAALRGADYIATFNGDTHTQQSPTITVDIARPAMLYVFYDDRMVIPHWLPETFEATNLTIGLDEGNMPPGNPNRSKEFILRQLEVGPGHSIDRTCSVWRRRIERAASVKLGPLGEGKISNNFRTMYGIAAQPL